MLVSLHVCSVAMDTLWTILRPCSEACIYFYGFSADAWLLMMDSRGNIQCVCVKIWWTMMFEPMSPRSLVVFRGSFNRRPDGGAAGTTGYRSSSCREHERLSSIRWLFGYFSLRHHNCPGILIWVCVFHTHVPAAALRVIPAGGLVECGRGAVYYVFNKCGGGGGGRRRLRHRSWTRLVHHGD